MVYDLIIIGSGPAGYTAGIYGVRAGLNVLILEGVCYGGQLMTTTDVENFPGFPTGVSGTELMLNMLKQCLHLGCTVENVDVISIEFGTVHTVFTDKHQYQTRTLIIATGATAKKLDLPNGDRYWNNGISACAVCDGALPMFRNQPLVVVGGGDTACEEALFLSRFGSSVHMLVRGDKMRASHRMRTRVLENSMIQVLYNTQIVDVVVVQDPHDTYLTGVIINREGTVETLDVAGLFYAIGHTPNTSF